MKSTYARESLIRGRHGGGYEIAIARDRRGGGDARAFRNGGGLSNLIVTRVFSPIASTALTVDPGQF